MGALQLPLSTFLLSETVLLLLLVAELLFPLHLLLLLVAELLFPLLGFPFLPQLLWLQLWLLQGCWTFKVCIVNLSTAPETPPTGHSIAERSVF